MKTMGWILVKALAFWAMMSLICGVMYPLAVTGVAQIAFAQEANGSMIEIDGQKYGSSLLAQQFTGEQYLWGRPMCIDTDTYTGDDGQPLMYAGASNKTPAGAEMESVIAKRVEAIKAAHRGMGDTPVPVELVTVSGSGLDPHISLAAAEYQIQRIAKNREMSTTQVEDIVLKYSNKKLLGFLGQETVNVLAVNLALDGLLE